MGCLILAKDGFMRIPWLLAGGLTTLMLRTHTVLAEEAKPASLSLQFSGLKWQESSSKEDGADATTKATQTLTADLVDGTLWLTFDERWNFYLYPFQDANALLSIGYMLREDLEIGVDLGLNSTKVTDPDAEVKSDIFGAFATWIVPVSSYALEIGAVYDLLTLKVKEADAVTGDMTTSNTTGSYMKVSSTLVIPLAKNAQYIGGVWYATDDSKTAGVKTKQSQLGLLLAGIRITLD